MRKILSIGLICIHLFGNTELGQLIKLPQLISHYQKHNKENPSVNFIKFLVMHYAGDDGTSADDKDDMQLPCHDYQHTAIFSVYASIYSSEILSNNLFYSSQVVYGGRLASFNPSEHIFSFLQPPRKA
jgi:hypothetical protein